jgi:hypothetical protein
MKTSQHVRSCHVPACLHAIAAVKLLGLKVGQLGEGSTNGLLRVNVKSHSSEQFHCMDVVLHSILDPS